MAKTPAASAPVPNVLPIERAASAAELLPAALGLLEDAELV